MKSREANYSKKVESRMQLLRDAEKSLLKSLREEYHLGTPVRVIHHQGEYTGVVIGHQSYGSRVGIQNDVSGKTLYRWYRDVEVITS